MMHKNLDYEAYIQNGVGDDYFTVGNYNLFMQCATPDKTAFRELLPHGFSFRLCRRDELEIWKRVVAEERYAGYVTEYYDKVYAKHADEFFRRCLFVCNDDDKPVASTFIWRSYEKINTVGWFRVLPEYEGRGLGRALLSEILKNTEYPAYLHTQPTSARAIKLYSDFGFKLLTDPIIGYRKNDLTESLPYLQKVLPQTDYTKLQFTEADKILLEAAKSSETSEF
jgi:ribosomal protein S18 acetylase RimI-like enzyme